MERRLNEQQSHDSFPHGGRSMIAYALVVGVLLTGQLRAGDERYPGKQTTDNPGSAATASPGNPGGSSLLPLDNPPAPISTGANNSPPAATPSGSNPFRSSPSSNPAPPRMLSLPESGAAPVGNNQSQTAPAAYEVSPPNNAGQALPGTEMKPSAMMRAMLSAPPGSQLRGQPVSLAEVISGARTRAEQTQRVDAYWDLCSSVADYYLGLREQEELRRLRSVIPRVDENWQKTETQFATRIGTSQRAALASQLRVASLMGRGAGNLPLPSDAPHCAKYLTHFEQVFPNGAPPEARELAALLPSRYAELSDAGVAVTQAEQWTESVARNDSDGTGTSKALKLLALQRRAFVQIARDYNRRIARYTELATPGQVSAERLTSMLINSTVSSTARRPALPTPPRNRQSSDESAPLRTFVEGSASGVNTVSATTKRDDSIRPASGTESAAKAISEPREEKSLVVPKR
jgi:hypothetical protein